MYQGYTQKNRQKVNKPHTKSLISFWIYSSYEHILSFTESMKEAGPKSYAPSITSTKTISTLSLKGKKRKERSQSIYSSSLCCPYTFWWTVCYLYNLLFLLSPLSSTIFLANGLYFCYIHLHNVMIRGPFWREDRVWSRNKLVWWAWWCQYVVYPSSILASPLHACDKEQFSLHLGKSLSWRILKKKVKCKAVYFGLWLSSLLTRIRPQSP